MTLNRRTLIRMSTVAIFGLSFPAWETLSAAAAPRQAKACSRVEVEPPSDIDAHDDAAAAHHTVVGVARAQARAYAAWVGGRLPRDAEWIRACQGDDGRKHPWGDQLPDATRANSAGTWAARPPTCQSPRPARHGRKRAGVGRAGQW